VEVSGAERSALTSALGIDFLYPTAEAQWTARV
jgi:hypothetical protein